MNVWRYNMKYETNIFGSDLELTTEINDKALESGKLIIKTLKCAELKDLNHQVIESINKIKNDEIDCFEKLDLVFYSNDLFNAKRDKNKLCNYLKNYFYYYNIFFDFLKSKFVENQGEYPTDILSCLLRYCFDLIENSDNPNINKKNWRIFYIKSIFNIYMDKLIDDDLKKILSDIENDAENMQHDFSIDSDIVYIKINKELSQLFEVYMNTERKIHNGKYHFNVRFIPETQSTIDKSVKFDIDDDINYLDISIKKNKDTNAIKAILCKISLKSLYDVYSENREDFFKLNLRYFIKKKQVDESIVKSLIENRDIFHLLHNGITMVCNQFTLGTNKVSVRNPSIVNGAQTISNIYDIVCKNYIEKDYLKNTYVICKIVQTENKSELINKISIAANTQKQIKYYESYANTEEIINITNYLQNYQISLISKVGDSGNNSFINMPMLTLTKLIMACVEQIPGSAYNALSSKLFENYFDEFFSFESDTNGYKYKMILFFLAIYYSWNQIKEKIDAEGNNKFLKSYGQFLFSAYFVLYTVYNNQLDDLINNLIVEDRLNYNEIIKRCNDDFMKNFVDCYNEAYKSNEDEYPGQKCFKKDNLYEWMINKKFQRDLKPIKEKIKKAFYEEEE